jgi:probable addiction module antidote protein
MNTEFSKDDIELSDWDMAEDIKTAEDVLYFLEAALEENDPEFMLTAIGDIARSKGMAQLAQKLGLPRESVYQNPSFTTVFKTLDELGFCLRIQPKKAIAKIA